MRKPTKFVCINNEFHGVPIGTPMRMIKRLVPEDPYWLDSFNAFPALYMCEYIKPNSYGHDCNGMSRPDFGRVLEVSEFIEDFSMVSSFIKSLDED